MKGNPYKMGKMATKSSMKMAKEAMKMKKESMAKLKDESAMKLKTSYKMKEAMAKMKDESAMKQTKPDFPDIDGDGNTTESMKKAAADKKSPMEQGKTKFMDKVKAAGRAIAKNIGNTGSGPREGMGPKVQRSYDKYKKEYRKAAADKKSMAKMKKGEAMKMKKESMAKQTKKQKEKLPAGLVKEIAKKAGKAGTAVAREGIKAAGSKVAGKKSAMPQKKKAKRKLSVADKLKAARTAVSTSDGPFGDSNFMDRYRDEKKNIRKGTYKGDSFKTG